MSKKVAPDGEHCIRDSFTIPKETRNAFALRCRQLGHKKSELIRQWIEWYLEETSTGEGEAPGLDNKEERQTIT